MKKKIFSIAAAMMLVAGLGATAQTDNKKNDQGAKGCTEQTCKVSDCKDGKDCTKSARKGKKHGKKSGKRDGRKGDLRMRADRKGAPGFDTSALTAEQRTQVDAIMKEQGQKMQALRDDARQKSDKVREESRAEMQKLRTETETKLSKVLNAEQLARFKQSMERRMGSKGPGRYGRDGRMGSGPRGGQRTQDLSSRMPAV